ncbi:MAG: Flp pilus assembly protein CpaB [Sandaracinobacteroides sp.]
MRRSSIFLLLGAVLLGLLAVLAARMVMTDKRPATEAQVPQTFVIVAAKPLKFGDKIAAESIKTQPWPGALPADAYADPREAIGDGNRTILRDVKEGELLVATAITGGAGRLASSTLLGADMRAVSIPVSEVSGAGGFLAPGDRVDVYLTRSFQDEVSYAGLIVQGARVLAVGQVSDTSASEPAVVKSTTIEVTPAEAQKLALAQTFGQLHLSLRATGDESRVPAQTVTAAEMFGMRPPPKENASAAPAAASSAPPRPRPIPGGAEVRVVRGTETSVYQVPR